MTRRLWLDAVPMGTRRAAIAVTVAILAVATPGLTLLPLSRLAIDGIAAVLVAAIGALWGAMYWRSARPELHRRRAHAEDRDSRRRHDRGLVAGRVGVDPRGGVGALVRGDPGFSLPGFLDLAASCLSIDADQVVVGPTRVLEVARRGADVVALVRVDARSRTGQRWSDEARVLTLVRPVAATSPPPGLLAAEGPDAWRLASSEPVQADDEERIFLDPDIAAERRALLARDALGSDGFEALFAELDRALDDGSALGWCTERGRSCVEWWTLGPGLPPGGPPSVWLDVEEDGWSERVEVARGERVLGLMRPAGQPEASWQLWRLRRRSS